MKALGMIEVYGYLAAVEALDSALKAANVNLLDVTLVQGGLVTVLVTGDVGAVKAAMDASKTAAEHVGKIVSVHVIPRPSEYIDRIIPPHNSNMVLSEEQVNKKLTPNIKQQPKVSIKKEVVDIEVNTEKVENTKSVENAESVEFTESAENTESAETTKSVEPIAVITEKEITPEVMKSMTVDRLRKLAREIKITNMTNKEIRFGTKNELIKSISEFIERDRT